jgi:urease accessory protein
MMGCDILALGLPAADAAWNHGSYRQHVEVQDIWLDRCLIRADDAMLLDSGLGWAGRRVLASLWFASGAPLSEARRTALVDAARSLIEMGESNRSINGINHHLLLASVSAAQSGLVVLRVLGLRVEPVQDLIRAIRMQWRALAWSASRHTPRIWGT